jgi:hypothetical protein
MPGRLIEIIFAVLVMDQIFGVADEYMYSGSVLAGFTDVHGSWARPQSFEAGPEEDA